MTSRPEPMVRGFHDSRTGSVQYVVTCPATLACAIIDPVLDFDEKSGSIATQHADELLHHVAQEKLTVEWILDTHPHADHLSAAAYLKEQTGARTAIGAKVTEVQKLWADIYYWPTFDTTGDQWDRLFRQGDEFAIGNLKGRVIHSPGHTLASITYVVGNAAFIHDTLFMPDSGTARADFPGGSANALWRSIQDILSLPAETRLFTGHDYAPHGRPAAWESTIASQREENEMIASGEGAFIEMRERKDKTLPMPRLILHALQININGGRLPAPEENGRRYLKIPIDALKDTVWD